MRNCILISFFILLSACSNVLPTDVAQLKKYVSAPENGLIRIRTVAGIRTAVTLYPPALNALREAGNATAQDDKVLPELIASYAGQLYFVVNLSTDGVNRTGDIMYSGVKDLKAFTQQAYDLNFKWDQMALLRCGSKTYRPTLSTLENTYGLTTDRNVVLVFSPTDKDDTEFHLSPFIELDITNDLFGTGVQHFKFRRADLERVQLETDRT